MKNIWKWIDSKGWAESVKYKAVIALFGGAFAAAGLCIWNVVRLWALDHWSWMVVFAGYPAFIAVVLIIIYSFNHSFHSGSFRK